MMSSRNAFQGGQRASDQPAPQAPPRRPDPDLEALIASEGIAVHFQPQIDPATGEIFGVEALARDEETDGADALFARAAAAGLEERLSRMMQRKSLRMAARWTGPLQGLGISINLLAQDIGREDFDRWLLDEIRTAAIDPRRVTLEITESGLIADSSTVADRLARLRETGISIAVDDFGTGYASLAYLTSLPLDSLKIDRGLIADIVGGERDRIVVRAMISLARELGLKVVVEGVESTAQLSLLAEWGCDLYQGFLGAGALTEEELARFVAASTLAAA